MSTEKHGMYCQEILSLKFLKSPRLKRSAAPLQGGEKMLSITVDGDISVL